jgi:hypothetical protein
MKILISLLDEYARLKTLSFPVCSLTRDAVSSYPGSGASFRSGAKTGNYPQDFKPGMGEGKRHRESYTAN